MKPCHFCGASDCDEKPIQKCGGCRLVGYCSVQCQKKDWKCHKTLCKLAPTLPSPRATALVWRPDNTDDSELEGDGGDVPREQLNLDLNTVLDYAAKYMVNLRYVNISIPQEFLLQNSYNHRSDRQVKLDACHFRSFLENCAALELCRFVFDDCCWIPVRRMTDNGRVFEPLARVHWETLKVLSLYMPVFGDVFVLANTIQGLPNLRKLDLIYLTIGSLNCGSWQGSETPVALATAISQHLHYLVNLNLRNGFFSDGHLGQLLSNIGSRLHVLSLAGMYGDCWRQQAGVDEITDDGFSTIARYCPNLQCLDLSEQRRATAAGVEHVLRSCLHLRSLDVSGVRITANDLLHLLPVAPQSLLMFSFRAYSADRATIERAVKATGGRILVRTDSMGLMEFSSLSAAHKAAYDHSMELVKQAYGNSGDPLCFNEWEFLFGVPS